MRSVHGVRSVHGWSCCCVSLSPRSAAGGSCGALGDLRTAAFQPPRRPCCAPRGGRRHAAGAQRAALRRACTRTSVRRSSQCVPREKAAPERTCSSDCPAWGTKPNSTITSSSTPLPTSAVGSGVTAPGTKLCAGGAPCQVGRRHRPFLVTRHLRRACPYATTAPPSLARLAQASSSPGCCLRHAAAPRCVATDGAPRRDVRRRAFRVPARSCDARSRCRLTCTERRQVRRCTSAAASGACQRSLRGTTSHQAAAAAPCAAASSHTPSDQQ